ncbi:Protein argonaute 1A, partial [Trichoplax sp. H2]
MAATALTKAALPQRNDFGKKGKRITVYANHYAISFQAENSIVQYDMQTNPEVKIKSDLRDFMTILQSSYSQLFRGVVTAFDGVRNIYASKRLNGIGSDRKTFTIDKEMRPGTIKSFKIQIKEVQLIQLTDLNRALRGETDVPYQAIQAVDVVLRCTLAKKFTMVYRSFYPEPVEGDWRSLGCGHESWRGYYQSARSTQTGLSLNIDTSHTAFYEAVLVHKYIARYFNQDEIRSLRDFQRKTMASELKNVKVTALHGDKKRKYRITDISNNKPNQIQFDHNGKRVSVTDYFKTTYGYTIRYPDLPCLKMNNKEIHLPMEVCEIVPGQYYKKKINERETASMVRFAAIPADQRRGKIDTFVNRTAQYSTDPVSKGFNIQVDPRMKKVDARVLSPVKISYRSGEMLPRDGSWNLQNAQFISSKQVHSWGCVWFRDRMLNPRKVEVLISKLKKSTADCGIEGI